VTQRYRAGFAEMPDFWRGSAAQSIDGRLGDASPPKRNEAPPERVARQRPVGASRRDARLLARQRRSIN